MAKFKHMQKLVSEARVKENLSQSTLSSRLGYSTSAFVHNVEKGMCSIPPKKFHLAAKELNISVKLLIHVAKLDLEAALVSTVKQNVKSEGWKMDKEGNIIEGGE